MHSNLLAILLSENIFLKSRLKSKHDLYELWDSSFKHHRISASCATLEELISGWVDVSGTVSLQVDVELGGTEGVALGAVCSFALKNNAKGRAAVCDAFHLHATLAQTHPFKKHPYTCCYRVCKWHGLSMLDSFLSSSKTGFCKS